MHIHLVGFTLWAVRNRLMCTKKFCVCICVMKEWRPRKCLSRAAQQRCHHALQITQRKESEAERKSERWNKVILPWTILNNKRYPWAFKQVLMENLLARSIVHQDIESLFFYMGMVPVTVTRELISFLCLVKWNQQDPLMVQLHWYIIYFLIFNLIIRHRCIASFLLWSWCSFL